MGGDYYDFRDGFAEQLDPADQPLGYEARADILGAAPGVPASELVERLLARVAAWRGEREQGDDITFVVVRVSRQGVTPERRSTRQA